MGFPDPAVSTGFVHQLLSALPNIVDAACGCASFLRERHRRFAVTLAVCHQCPDRPGGLVRQGNRSDFLRAPGKQLDEPPALSTVPLDMADHGHGADNQHLAQIAVACPRDAAEPLLATARVLLGYKADPCCHVPWDRRCCRRTRWRAAGRLPGSPSGGDLPHSVSRALARMRRSFSRICSFTTASCP